MRVVIMPLFLLLAVAFFPRPQLRRVASKWTREAEIVVEAGSHTVYVRFFRRAPSAFTSVAWSGAATTRLVLRASGTVVSPLMQLRRSRMTVGAELRSSQRLAVRMMRSCESSGFAML
jgi:hypothetical protein